MWGIAKRTYLDWAAASPVSERARRVFSAALMAYGNPGALHAEARSAKALLEDARTRIARLAEVKTDGVVFTSGATEANALALLGSVRARGVVGAHILYQASAHASVVGALELLKEEGATIEALDLARVKEQLRPETALITLDAVNSETGERFDTLSVRRAIDGEKRSTLLHVDASQAPIAESITLAHWGADLMTLDAQKVGAVRGIGVLLMRQGIALAPLTRGGGQEGGRRPGTESPALASAFATALTESAELREKFVEQSARMRTILIDHLARIPRLEINEGKDTVSHILNISLLGRDTDYAVTLLDTAGFAVSTKSACETDEPGSRAVRALTHDEERAAATLRISWGHDTTEKDLERFAEELIRVVRFLDASAL